MVPIFFFLRRILSEISVYYKLKYKRKMVRIALYRIPHFRSIEEIWAESNLAVVCGTKSRNSIVSEMAI